MYHSGVRPRSRFRQTKTHSGWETRIGLSYTLFKCYFRNPRKQALLDQIVTALPPNQNMSCSEYFQPEWKYGDENSCFDRNRLSTKLIHKKCPTQKARQTYPKNLCLFPVTRLHWLNFMSNLACQRLTPEYIVGEYFVRPRLGLTETPCRRSRFDQKWRAIEHPRTEDGWWSTPPEHLQTRTLSLQIMWIRCPHPHKLALSVCISLCVWCASKHASLASIQGVVVSIIVVGCLYVVNNQHAMS